MAKAFSIQADGTKGVPWMEFARALMDIGMNAAQGSGSAVVFNNHLESLSFHKPHPKPVVNAIKLRRSGARSNPPGDPEPISPASCYLKTAMRWS
jgi:hypothetical protein